MCIFILTSGSVNPAKCFGSQGSRLAHVFLQGGAQLRADGLQLLRLSRGHRLRAEIPDLLFKFTKCHEGQG